MAYKATVWTEDNEYEIGSYKTREKANEELDDYLRDRTEIDDSPITGGVVSKE